jgi:hypothetical protein
MRFAAMSSRPFDNLAATVADEQIPEDFRISGNGIHHGCTAFPSGRTPAPREVHLRRSFGQPFRESLARAVRSAEWSSQSP